VGSLEDRRSRDASKTMVHPMQSNWVKVCARQDEYHQLFGPALKEAQQFYRKEVENGVPGGRLDMGAMLDDVKRGVLPEAMKAAHRAFVDSRRLMKGKPRPTERLMGVELSPGGKPMRPHKQPTVDNINLLRKNDVVVSRDVWGQLTQEQAEKLIENPGIHQFSNVTTSAISEANPTGTWTDFEKDLGDEVVSIDNGATTKLFSFKAEITAVVDKVIPEPVSFVVPKHYNDYGIPEGTPIKVSHLGVEFLPNSNGAQNYKLATVKKKLRAFEFRDPVGRHLDDITIVGEIDKKWDGIFHYATIRDNNLTIRARNGIVYRASGIDCCDLDFAFEQNSGAAKVLYVRFLGENNIPYHGPVHRYFNKRLKLHISGGLEADTEIEFEWQSDGNVIKNESGHHFIKKTKTVDIVTEQAMRLRSEGYYISGFTPERRGQIWELDITTRGLTGPRIRKRPIKEENGVAVMVEDKIFPNRVTRVKYAMAAPDWNAYRRHHKI